MYRANHISAFLFIRAYHRAIANDMNIRDLAKKLDVDVKYIIHRRQYLSKLLGVTFPKLRSSAKELEKKELKRMVVACHTLVKRKQKVFSYRNN